MINDLRDWMHSMEQADGLKEITGADWENEIGVIVDIMQEEMGRPALLFDEIKGYPKGYRVLANVLASMEGIAFALGVPPENVTEKHLIQKWRDYLQNFELIKPKMVKDGPIYENIYQGKEVNLFKFPVPKWHEHDGGRYIGTACMVIQKDPDTEWINLGAYRVMIHRDNLAGIYMTVGRHGDIIARKYWEKGQPCPVVVSVGQDPLVFMLAGLPLPFGVCEYDVAGGIKGSPVEVVKGVTTDLPIPATAEIVFEGEMTPSDILEGPFGEWTGYYGTGERPAPIIQVTSVLHRNSPILMGCIPAMPQNDDRYYGTFYECAAAHHQLEKVGVPGVERVWGFDGGAGRMMVVVSIKQMYPGHAKQVGLVTSQCHAYAYANKSVIVVDEDVDPTDANEVIWALCTRMDPREDIEIIRKCWSSPLDPMSYPEDKRCYNARVVIDACIPWETRDTFPPVVKPSEEHVQMVLRKWPELRSYHKGR